MRLHAVVLLVAAAAAAALAQCPPNSELREGTCVCPHGFRWDDESCLPCDGGTFNDGRADTADSGLHGPCIECPAETTLGAGPVPTFASSPAGAVTCSCLAGYRMQVESDRPLEVTEAPCVPCAAGTFGAGFTRATGCEACPCGRTTSGEEGRTFCDCPSGSTRDAGSDECVCDDARKVFSCAAERCVCDEGYLTYPDGSCHICPEGQILLDDDAMARVCECPYGQLEVDDTSECACPEGTELQADAGDATDRACCPPERTYVRGAGCTCPEGESERGGDGVCRPDVADGDLVPVFECVDEASPADGGGLVARFGYQNRLGEAVAVPVGEDNHFGDDAAAPGASAGQPEDFLASPYVSDAVSVPLPDDGSSVTWRLLGQAASAAAGSARCDRPVVCHDVDFEAMAQGETAAGQFLFSGLVARLASPSGDGAGRLAAFDTATPSSSLAALGTPNAACEGGGPGVGAGGAGTTCEALGRVLVAALPAADADAAAAAERGGPVVSFPLPVGGPVAVSLEWDSPVTLGEVALLNAAPADTVSVTYAPDPSRPGETSTLVFEAGDAFAGGANAAAAVRVGVAGVTRAVVSLGGGAAGPAAISAVRFCEDTPLASCDDVLRRRPHGAPDGVYRVLDSSQPSGERRVYCLFDDGGNRDCHEELFDEESIRRGGLFRLSNHKSGNRAPPLYGLRLDRLEENGRYWTFDFDHPSSDLRMRWEPEQSRLRVFGHVYGGPDVGSEYAEGYPHRYFVDFVYEGVEVDGAGLYAAERAGNGGSITDLTAEPPLTRALEPFMYFRLKRYHRGESVRYSGYGWVNHSGKPHVYSSDFLFTVGGCDNEDRRGWTRVMRQDTRASAGGGYFDAAAVAGGDVSGDDPTAPLYSSLATVLPRLEGEHGFEFLMEWPGLEGRQIWQQRGNFMRGERVGEWSPHELPYTGRFFGGLEPGSGGRAAADGSVDSTQWFYAVASYAAARGDCPLPGPFGCVEGATLYARPARVAPAATVAHCGDDCREEDGFQCVATVPWVGPACVPVDAPATCVEAAAAAAGAGDGDSDDGAAGAPAYCFGDHLVAYYPLDESEGDVAHDRSGRGVPLNLRLSGGAEWDAEGGVRVAADGAAVESEAAASKVVHAAREANALTVELWLRASAASAAGQEPGETGASVFSIDEGDDCVHQQGVAVAHAAGGAGLRYRLATSRATTCAGGAEASYAAASAAVDGADEACTHVVLTWNGARKALYVNGAAVESDSAGSDSPPGDLSALNPASFLRLGNSRSRARRWGGAVLSAAVWSAAASPADVAALHARGCGGAPASCALVLEAERDAPVFVRPSEVEAPFLAACSGEPAEGIDGWTRVLYQDYTGEGPFPPSFPLADRGYGTRAPGAGLVSALHTLGRFRGPDGYLFRLRYPGQQETAGLGDIVWAQTGNPAAGDDAGFRFSLGGCDTPDGFRGLRLGADPSRSFLDGTASEQGAWAFAVGTTRELLAGMPVVPGGALATSVELWVRPAEFGGLSGCSCGDGFRCVQDGDAASCVPADAPATCAEALEGGAPDGEYWLAGDLRAHCSADDEGRAWTRVFSHDSRCAGGSSYFESPASRLADEGVNALRPCACRFSALDRLAGMAGEDGLDLRLRWTLADGGGAVVDENRWRQAGSPVDDAGDAATGAASGYVPLLLRYADASFGGLRRAGDGAPTLLTAGAGGAAAHAYGVGAVEPAEDAALCPFHAAPGVCAVAVELLAAPVAAGQAACPACGDDEERHPDEFSACKCGPRAEDRHCAEILEREPGSADGEYWVDPDLDAAGGLRSLLVECDMSADPKGNAGFTLVAFQDCGSGGFFPPGFDLAASRYDPRHGRAFSMLNQLEELRGPGGFLFRLEWPGSGLAPQTWIQRSNPVTGGDGGVEGYLPVSVPHAEHGWAGLRRSDGGSTLLHGDGGGDGSWYFAIGATERFGCGAPGPDGCVPESRLWARPAPGCDCDAGAGERCWYLDLGGHACLPASLPASCAAVAAAGAARDGEPVEGEPDAFAHWVDGDGDGPADPWQASCVLRDFAFLIGERTEEVEPVSPGENARTFCFAPSFNAVGGLVDVAVHAAVTGGSGASAVRVGSGNGAPLAGPSEAEAGAQTCYELPLLAADGEWDDAEVTVWLSYGLGDAEPASQRNVVELLLPVQRRREPAQPAVALVTAATGSVSPGKWSLVTLSWSSTECVTGVEATLGDLPDGWQVRYNGGGGSRGRGGDGAELCPGETLSTEVWVKPPRGDCGETELAASASYVRASGEAASDATGEFVVPVRCVTIEGVGLVLGRCHRHAGRSSTGGVFVVVRARVVGDSDLDVSDYAVTPVHPAATFIVGAVVRRFSGDVSVYQLLYIRCDDLGGFGRHRIHVRGTCSVGGRLRFISWHFDVEHEDRRSGKRLAGPAAAADDAEALAGVSQSPLGLYGVSPVAMTLASSSGAFALTLEASGGKDLAGVAVSLATSAGTLSFPDGAAAASLAGGAGSLAAGESAAVMFSLDVSGVPAGSVTLTLEVSVESDGLPVTETHRLEVRVDPREVALASTDMGLLNAATGVAQYSFEAPAADGVTGLAVTSARGPAGVSVNATVVPGAEEGDAAVVTVTVDASGAPASERGLLYAELDLSYRLHGVTRERSETVSVRDSRDAEEAPASSSSVWSAATIAGVAVAAVVVLAAGAVLARRAAVRRAGGAGAGMAAAAKASRHHATPSEGGLSRASSSFSFNQVASNMAAGRSLSISEVKAVYDDVYDDQDAANEDASSVAMAELALQRSQDVVSRAKSAVEAARRVERDSAEGPSA